MARRNEASSENVDLDPERKEEILRLEEGLDRMNHFEVLGLPPGASFPEVRQAYFDASLKFHPDRFFQKKIGSFASRLERIFKRLTEANLVLTDPQLRKSYERAHPHLIRATPVASQPDREAVPFGPADPVRGAERRARLAKHPYLAKAARFGELVARAKRHTIEGEYEQAVSELEAASHAAPQNRDLHTLLEQTRNSQQFDRTAQELKRGETAEANGELDRAIGCYRAAANLDKRNAVAAAKAAGLLLKMGKEAPDACGLAQRAVELEPQNIEYRCLLGEILVGSGMKKQAKVQFQEAAKINPEHPKVKNGLKKVRWLF